MNMCHVFQMMIVLEFMPKGDLRGFLNRQRLRYGFMLIALCFLSYMFSMTAYYYIAVLVRWYLEICPSFVCNSAIKLLLGWHICLGSHLYTETLQPEMYWCLRTTFARYKLS